MARATVVRANGSVALRDGAVRLAVVADTHSAPHPRAAELLRAARPDAILHAGDIGDVSVLRELEQVAPVLAVRGNVDGRGGLPDELTIDLVDDRGGVALRLFMTHIAVYGPKLRGEAAKAAHAQKASLVVCGHSHVPFIGVDKGLTIFNPGSIGPRRFHLPIVFGLMDLRDGRLAMQHVSCETGARWEP
ncbi:MAG: metallophosphoesterase family protein [Deltaproteobacteria bacterium]|nr:metallophosphoesterase family protein [Deltaproteobacteria bacterium]